MLMNYCGTLPKRQGLRVPLYSIKGEILPCILPKRPFHVFGNLVLPQYYAGYINSRIFNLVDITTASIDFVLAAAAEAAARCGQTFKSLCPHNFVSQEIALFILP